MRDSFRYTALRPNVGDTFSSSDFKPCLIPSCKWLTSCDM
eukprot:Gb_29164 [translate_table: standard]